MTSISAVLFDFDHTLGLDHHLEHDVMAQLAADVCKQPQQPTDVDAALARFRSGKEHLDDVLVESFRAWGCPESRLALIPDDFRAACLREAPARVTPIDGAREMLAALHARTMTLGILSNGWTELQMLKARLLGFRGPVFVSEQIGAWKPDLYAFLIAVQRMHVAAGATMYAGDEPAVDVAGAKAAGMLAAWADFEGKQYPADIVKPDLVVRDWRLFVEAVS